jgi:uncharacterized protein (TIGR02284 family)
MTAHTDHAAELLNRLIPTTLDSADGYELAADLVRNPRFKTLFQERAAARHHLCEQLKAEVRGFDVVPEVNGSLVAEAHRALLDLRDRISGGSDRAVIDEVERGEGYLESQYQSVAADPELSGEARELVEKAFGTIKTDHASIRDLKDQFH